MADLLYVMGFLPELTPEVGKLDFDLEKFHVTLMQDHAIPDRNIDEYLSKLNSVAKWFSPVFYDIGAEEVFQSKLGDNISVVTLKTVEGIALHKSIMDIVISLEGTFASKFIGDDYSPHISFWNDPKPFIMETFSLIHHKDGFGQNVVNLANFNLKG